MPILDNPRWEAFAQRVASGMPAGRAYEAAGYSARGHVADVNAMRLLTKAYIKVRVAALVKAESAKAEMTRDDLRRYLIECIETPVGNVNRNHRLAQASKETDKLTEIRMPDKLRAAEQLAKLCGWNEEKPEAPTLKIVIGGDA